MEDDKKDDDIRPPDGMSMVETLAWWRARVTSLDRNLRLLQAHAKEQSMVGWDQEARQTRIVMQLIRASKKEAVGYVGMHAVVVEHALAHGLDPATSRCKYMPRPDGRPGGFPVASVTP